MINFVALFTFYVFTYFLGRGALLIFSKIKILNITVIDENKNLFSVPINVFYPIIGFFVIGNLSILFNFFVSLSSVFTYSMFIFLFLGNFLKKMNIKIQIQEFYLFFVTLPILSVSSYLTGLSYDAGLYHLNYQSWLQDEKIILGLSNFHARLGYSSIYEFINVNFWQGNNHLIQHFVNLTFIAFFFTVMHYVYYNSKNLSVRIGILGILVFGLLDNFGFAGGKNGFIEIEGVTKYDTPFGIIFFLIVIFTSIHYLEKRTNDEELVLLLIFTLFSIQMRVTGVLLLILVMPILFKKNIVRSIKTNSLIIIFGISNILKNLLTTGCMYFPIEFTCFDYFNWYKSGFAETERNSISFALRSFDFSKPFGEWFQIWIEKYEYNLPTLKNFVFSLLVLAILRILLTRENTFSMVKVLYFLFNFFMFSYWIFTAPSFRYGTGLFLSFIYFGSFFTPKSPRYSFIIKKNFFMFLMFITILLLPRIDNYFKLLSDPLKLTIIEARKVDYIDKEFGFGVSPKDHNEICMVNKYCSPVYSNNTKFKVNKYDYKYFELKN